jgi:hypothetical protein
MQPGKPKPILKPTLDTQFHIDYGWWDRENQDLRSYMLTHLPTDLRETFDEADDEERIIDYIDPETGEVFQLDALGTVIREAAKREDFINPQTSLVDSVFRVFLANGNTPRTPRELEAETGRDARTILKTFGGIRVYRGIRPIHTNDN